ncbi:MAG: response regulator [Bacteroidales bacterium]|nr:response regulator [Bacteroidales bacterium]
MNRKILVVDDSESIREVVKFTLENNGYDVILGNDGKDAINYLDGRHLDMIITDLHMPEMDGIELIKIIRSKEEYSTTPILFLTTESQVNKKLQAKEAGATGWIIKPFAPQKLIMAINKVIK